jgi:F0F1-type ATP synthase membrane subunit c/vacuolar-type H+-ATPase subunit K
VGLADLVAWALLWPALLAVRLQGVSSNRGLWILALMMVIALGYIANRYGFGRAFDPSVAGSVRGTMLAELFTILMPVLAVIFGLVIFFALRMWGNG